MYKALTRQLACNKYIRNTKNNQLLSISKWIVAYTYVDRKETFPTFATTRSYPTQQNIAQKIHDRCRRHSFKKSEHHCVTCNDRRIERASVSKPYEHIEKRTNWPGECILETTAFSIPYIYSHGSSTNLRATASYSELQKSSRMKSNWYHTYAENIGAWILPKLRIARQHKVQYFVYYGTCNKKIAESRANGSWWILKYGGIKFRIGNEHQGQLYVWQQFKSEYWCGHKYWNIDQIRSSQDSRTGTAAQFTLWQRQQLRIAQINVYRWRQQRSETPSTQSTKNNTVNSFNPVWPCTFWILGLDMDRKTKGRTYLKEDNPLTHGEQPSIRNWMISPWTWTVQDLWVGCGWPAVVSGRKTGREWRWRVNSVARANQEGRDRGRIG